MLLASEMIPSLTCYIPTIGYLVSQRIEVGVEWTGKSLYGSVNEKRKNKIFFLLKYEYGASILCEMK